MIGLLGGGYYFHNIALTVVQGARYPEKNVRNVFLGYLATFLTYVLCGTLGCYGFLGKKFEPFLVKNKGDITGNDLDMFSNDAVPATFIRFCAFAQLLTINALMVRLERSQILLLVTGKQDASTNKVHILMNLAILTPAFIIAIVYPKISSLASLLSAFASLFVVYLIPVCTYLKFKQSAIYNPELATLVQRSTVTTVLSQSPSGSMIDESN